MRRLGAVICGALLMAGWPPARAPAAPISDNTVRLAPSQLKLPQNIGPLRYHGQRRFDDRRLGNAYLFNASGISLSLYVYDFGIGKLADGPDSIAVCEQYESAKQEIETGANYGKVRLVGEVSRRLMPGPEVPRVREARYELERNGIAATSLLWITAVDGNFLKMRLSLRAEVADELDEARSQILAAIARAVAARPGRRAQMPPATQEAAVEVDRHHDDVSSALWLAYGMDLVRWSRQRPEARPACGGLLVPDWSAELAARHAALTALRARPAATWPAYWAELARIEDAGYLDEYVWQHLRPGEGGAPSALDLEKFESFLARELPRHLAQSGARVRILEPRPLPSAD